MDFSAVESVRIKVMKLESAAQLPRYAHVGPYGDLAADLYAVAGLTLNAGRLRLLRRVCSDGVSGDPWGACGGTGRGWPCVE